MLGSAIRELAASKVATRIAAAFFKNAVQIWDLKSQKDICEFSTIFCSGAGNLALAPDGSMLVAGLSRERGKIASYEIPTGKRLWERKLTFPSHLRFDSTGQSILCTSNGKSVFRLDASTGVTLDVIDETSRYIEGQHGDVLLVPTNNGNNPYRLVAGNRSFDISRLSFTLLSAKFSPHSVCLTEAAGPVRCFSRDDGRLRWMFDPGNDSHVPLLHYSSTLDAFFGVVRNLKLEGVNKLMMFESMSGVNESICDLDSWAEVFVGGEDQLVTSNGEIRNLSNGALFGRLAFPLKDYPDE